MDLDAAAVVQVEKKNRLVYSDPFPKVTVQEAEEMFDFGVSLNYMSTTMIISSSQDILQISPDVTVVRGCNNVIETRL